MVEQWNSGCGIGEQWNSEVEQCRWNSEVEQCRWNSEVELCWWKSVVEQCCRSSGTVIVEQCGGKWKSVG